MRGPNEIDFWRGFALLTIFIDHVPGLVFSNYTMRYFGLCDAAELFVFLAGWSLRLLMDGRKEPMSLPSAVMRLETRAMTIFFAQPYRRRELTYAMIHAVLEKLRRDKPALAPLRVWAAWLFGSCG